MITGDFIDLEERYGAHNYQPLDVVLDVLCKETHERVIRISPSLVITTEQIDWAVERIGDALRRMQ